MRKISWLTYLETISFRGAYCSIYEKESCIEIFDTQMDVMADDLLEMADKMIQVAWSSTCTLEIQETISTLVAPYINSSA